MFIRTNNVVFSIMYKTTNIKGNISTGKANVPSITIYYLQIFNHSRTVTATKVEIFSQVNIRVVVLYQSVDVYSRRKDR